MSLARLGNEQAFGAIVERYRRELEAHARRLRSDGRTDDLVQQTFLSAFAALRSGTDVKHLRGWLYRILRNEAIRMSTRQIVEVELDPASIAGESLEEASQRRMLAFQTLSSIAALPTRQREALVATALDGHSRAAVADAMGLSEGAVRQLMHRARAKLRAAVAAITPAPLTNWLATSRGSASGAGPEFAIGGGSASAAGVALKLGAFLASGAVATGIVGSAVISPPGRPASARAQRARLGGLGNKPVLGVSNVGPHSGTTGVATVVVRPAGVIGGSHAGAAAKPIDLKARGSGRNGSQTHTSSGPGGEGTVMSGEFGTGPDASGASRSDNGQGRANEGEGGGSPTAGGDGQPAGGGSTGRDGSGGGHGGSGGDSHSETASGGGHESGSDGSGAASAGVTTPSVDGSHDGAASGGNVLSPSGSSSDGLSSASGSSDGGSSGASGSDGGGSQTNGSSSGG